MTLVKDWIRAGSTLFNTVYQTKYTRKIMSDEDFYELTRTLSFPSDYIENKSDFYTNLFILVEYAKKKKYQMAALANTIKRLLIKDLDGFQESFITSKQKEMISYMDRVLGVL